MTRVTIEGSVSPSTYLPRGQRRTVELTDFIVKLARGGYVTIIEHHADEVPAAAAAVEPVKRQRRRAPRRTPEDDDDAE
jgi:hypothetical protein